MKRTETVKQFIRDFHSMWLEGMSIAEIAEKKNVSLRHAYILLEEIAMNNGVTREDYLVYAPYERKSMKYPVSKQIHHKYTLDSIHEVKDGFELLLRDLDETSQLLNDTQKIIDRIMGGNING